MKRYSVAFGLIVAGTFFSSANADDLMQVYRQAVKSDPVFAQAESTWRSQKMNLPIAEAGYLPHVSVSGNTDRVYDELMPGISTTTTGTSWKYGYGLTLTQPIFNGPAWSAIKGANALVKSVTATYLAAQQSLMQRTAEAYFNVLQAYDLLRYTIANKRAVWEQFVTARQQFKVGLIAITDEYDARSRYDQVVAQQIVAQNNLNVQLENLRAITGKFYPSLRGLSEKLVLLKPQPNNINRWVSVASQQNYNLIAQNYAVIVAMDAIRQAAGAGYPSLNFEGGVSENHTVSNTGGIGITYGDTAEHIETVGLKLSYAPLQGGSVVASTQQARYNYTTASGKLEQVYRDVVNKTRSSFLGILSNVSQIAADKHSIVSANNALEATQAGLQVGTRTMVDVLSALTALYQAQKQYANDQYLYINNLVALKAAAGTLSVNDLREINGWLGKSISFPEQTSVSIMPVEDEKADKNENQKEQLKTGEPALPKKNGNHEMLPVKSEKIEKSAKSEKSSVKAEKSAKAAKKEKSVKIKTESDHYPVEKNALDKLIEPPAKLITPLPQPTST